MSSTHCLETTWNWSTFLFAHSLHLSTYFSPCSAMSYVQATASAWDLSQPSKSFTIPAEIKDSSKSLFSCAISKLGLHSSCVHPELYLIHWKSWLFDIYWLHQFVPHGFQVVKKHSQCGTFPYRFLSRPSQMVVPTAVLLWEAAHSSRVVPLGLEFCPTIFGQRDPSGRIQMVGHSDSSSLHDCGAISLDCKPILHLSLLLRILEVWKSHPKNKRLSCATRKILPR